MKHITAARQYNQGKIAAIECVKRDSLCDVHIQNDCFLLLILLEGSLQFTLNNKTYTAVSPCFVCFNETADPCFTKDPRRGVAAVYFHPTFLNVNMTFDVLRSAVYEDLALNHDLFLLKPFIDGPRILPIVESQLEKVQHTFEEMSEELSVQRDWYWSCRSRSYFMELIILVERMYGITGYGDNEEAPNAVAAVDDERLKKALLYIEAHYTELITLEDIACSSGVNRVTLSMLFKKGWGITVMQYLSRYRIAVAKKQLEFTELSVKEIAVRCGFKTVPHFTRVFKQQIGMTPTEFRKNAVNKRKEEIRLENHI